MVIDSHYHLEERMETVDRLLGEMDRYGINRIALISAFTDPFTVDWITWKLGDLVRKVLLSRMHGIGLRLYKLQVTGDGQYSFLIKRYPIYNEPDNANVARVIQAHPDRFVGWISVNPAVTEPVKEVERWITQPGWIGVKTHPFMHRYSVKKLDDVAGYCVEKGLPMLLHLGGDSGNGDYQYLPDRHPNLKIIYAHAGIPFYKELWDYAKKKNNVFVDLSSGYLDRALRLNVIKILGVEKCIYGSDGPYGCVEDNGLYDHGEILNEIIRLPISEDDKRRILGDNFKEITGI